MITIAPERPEDWEIVETLFDLAFAPGRAALSSYRLREAIPPLADLARVAREQSGVLVGAIRLWPVQIGAKAWPALLVGPVAVHPTFQGEGIGGALIEESLAAACKQGWKRAILIGDEPYYRRFGFSRARAQALLFPEPCNPARLLARDLVPDAMAGVSGMVRRWNKTSE